ncbi:D-lactaldehyde dehydrogenase [Trametes sanguinea]|nr:D-lactaldehyde dehydrogenase [Trametes sanguinea]
MPSITSGRVLVTGANGYAATWILKELLERGFKVRGTIRSESKAAFVRNIFKSFGDKLELVVIPDATKDGAHDDAVKDVDAILHVASPTNLNPKDPDDVIPPAIQSTLSLLQSALKHRNTVKRVVLTSSVVALAPLAGPDDEPKVVDETMWNDVAVEHVREKGKDSNPRMVYPASKTLAEREAWTFWKKENEKLGGKLGWDLVTLVPPFILGPILNDITKTEQLNGPIQYFYFAVAKGIYQDDENALVRSGYQYIDVRDFAKTQVESLLKEEAGGQRLIVTGHEFVWQQFIDVARKYTDKIPRGRPEAYDPSKVVFQIKYNSEKSRRILGVQYRSIEDTVKDTIEDYKTKGWL